MEVRRAWTRAWSVVGIALALTGCGKTATPDNPKSNLPDPTDPEPQERLVPWQLEANGAAPLTIGIFDQKRGEHCSFVPDRDGTLRCLPLPATTVELQLLNYADAACTQPIYYAPYAKNAQVLLDRNVAVPLPSEGCETRYAVGTLKEIPASQRFYPRDTGCVALGAPAQEEGSHDFMLEQEADPKGWVSAKEVDGPLLGDRVRVRRFATDDGEFDARLVDERWNKPCQVFDASEAVVCDVAKLRNISNYHVDAECKQGYLWPASTCPEPAYIGDFGLSGDKFALGPLWAGDVFSMGKRCEPADISYEGEQGFWQRGEPLGADAVAVVSSTREGTDRLELMGLRADDGSLQVLSDTVLGGSPGRSAHDARFYDTQLDVGCRPVWTPDAGVRCVPTTTLIDPYT